MSDMDQYSRYFPSGERVGVVIPMPNAQVFKDWARILSISEDLVSLQLSRDILPQNVSLQYGQILELRGGKEGSGYCCRAIIVSESAEQEFLLRLIGEIVSDELREFYRIDAFLPIKYFVSREQHVEVLHRDWEKRRARRLRMEMRQKESHWQTSLVAAEAVLPQERLQDVNAAREDIGGDQPHDSWETIIPLAANISGGGLRIITHQGFDDGEFVLLEILVPTPQRIVDVVGRVIFANRNFAAGNDQEYFNTGIQFVYIDESDRDAIVSHISNIQLKRIRQLRERYLFRGDDISAYSTDLPGKLTFRKIAGVLAAIIMFLLISATLITYFWNYAHNHPKGEIERTFEDAIKKYREKLQ